MLARLCIRACGRLGGYFPQESELSTPDNPTIKKSLSAMLTPYLARKLASEQPQEVRSRVMAHHFGDELCGIKVKGHVSCENHKDFVQKVNDKFDFHWNRSQNF